MTDEIDELLANFAKELDYFVFTRDHLAPVMRELLRAIERCIADRTDMVARGEGRHLRGTYVEKLGGVQPLLEEWVRIRGSGDRLWDAEHAMSAAQYKRFQALLSREAAISQGRENFDSLQDHLRRRLLLFEEMTG